MKLRFVQGVLLMVLAVGLSGSSLAAKPKTSTVCKSAGSRMHCHAVAIDGADGQPLASSTPAGYSPAQFRTAYQSVVRSSAVRLGIVVVSHNASLASDVATFSRQYGLAGLPTCGSASQNGCLEVRDESGGVQYPVADSGWALEEDLDVESTHGQCPGCRIEVVEANTSSLIDLGNAEDEAVKLGGRIVSNSWGGSEMSKEAAFDTHFAHSGVTYVFSSGDNGYHTSYPAASASVLAVGGTSLTLNTGGARQAEAVWKGSGSGCSRYESKPSWQSDRGCGDRSIADIAADADPATGAAVYHAGHWYEVGGTSLAAPLVAGMMAASGAVDSPATVDHRAAAGSTNDVTSGKTSTCGLYLCTGTLGYDGPTGWGSPIASRLF